MGYWDEIISVLLNLKLLYIYNLYYIYNEMFEMF